MKAIIPLDPENLGGDSHTLDEGYFAVLAERDKIVLIEFHSIVPPITWVQNFELMYCQRQHDPEMIKVVRKATEEERKGFRVPSWIQGDEIPECCGRAMYFVGQIDGDCICSESPPDAKLWWHDSASFYVFTCPVCLEVKAVGQQF